MRLNVPARRAAIVMCFAAVIGWHAYIAAALGSEITVTDDFRDVAAAVAHYADEFGPQHVLLVVDIDNTLLAMNGDLGSDQWFEWQKYLLDHAPSSHGLVADSFEDLLAVQGLLFHIGHMHPPQPDLPLIVRRLQARGVHSLVLTSRGPEFRVFTERELRRNGYDFVASALPAHKLPRGAYLPYDLDNLAAAGLAQRDVRALDLQVPRPITYEGGVMMTAGQPKAAMLLTILHHSDADIRAIVYADDHIRHVAFVFAAMAGRGLHVTGFAYTREEPRVQAFQYGDKTDVSRRWRKLNRVFDKVFE